MRSAWSAAAIVLLVAVLAGCQLGKGNNNCVGEPGEAGGGVSVCTKPPPPQFSQFGQ